MVGVIDLPSSPPFMAGSPRLVSFSTDQDSMLGGPSQRLIRLGTRFSLDVKYNPMDYQDAMGFISTLVQSEAVAVSVPFPQRGIGQAYLNSAGNPLVNTSSLAGLVFKIRNAPVGYNLYAGQFFSFVTNGRRSLHMITANATIASDGTATLSIYPMLRTTPNDGDTVEITQPRIEGFLPTSSATWSIEMMSLVGLQFTIKEDR